VIANSSGTDTTAPTAKGTTKGAETSRPLNVFVHLAADKDAVAWREAWLARTLVGINDETPYGYGRATTMGCRVVFSRTTPEALPVKVVRLGLRVLTGFDAIHAFRQRRAMGEADVVWTHTESQYLAVAAILALSKRRPKLLGQSVWLFDLWNKLTPLHKLLYRRLIRHVDVLTVHSSENFAVAKALFPGKRIVLVPFGIPSEEMTEPVPRAGKPFRILSIGNDRHRDWTCLASALDGVDDAEAVILSGTAPRSLTPSGITVIQEAVLAGVPVIATATGGLEGYFGTDAVRYVPPGDPDALRDALREIAGDPEAARQRAVRAQRHMVEAGIGAQSFIRQHVELSHDLVGR